MDVGVKLKKNVFFILASTLLRFPSNFCPPLVFQHFTETLDRMEDLVIRIQSQKASLESIREDILPKLLEGRKLIEEFATESTFERG